MGSRFNGEFQGFDGHPYQEDLIDFSVSDTWRRHYFQEGYTPIGPMVSESLDRERKIRHRLEVLEREQADGAETLRDLMAEIAHIQESLTPQTLQRRQSERKPMRKDGWGFQGIPEDLVS